MPHLNLEDNHEDILAKAMRGLGISKNEIAQRLGVNRSQIASVLHGDLNEEIIKSMAVELNLDQGKIIKLAKKQYSPNPIEITGLKQISSPYKDMIVNAYLVWDQVTKNTWIFDTGTEIEPILNTLDSMELHVDAIFLTHTHRDHISCLEDLNEELINKSTYVHKLELLDDCIPIDEGFELKNGSLAVKALHTHGHSEGGITYVIDGLSRPLAIVGDAVFAGSMGGCNFIHRCLGY